MHRRLSQVLGALASVVLFAPPPAFAFIPTWETQGSYIHLMAHFLFAVAMAFLIYEIYRGELRGMPGFRSLLWACALLVWWNLDAIVGHALDWTLSNPVVLGTGVDRRLLMENAHIWGYYVTKITHFAIIIPAFYFFYRSLKRFSQEEEARES
jgi:hypothetical protein|uniref:TIGR02206 family membrane protein n=1 Tax=Desulfobacca acetoxidans TaxID=60893 RepID=A0A7V6DQG1_9BACT